MGGALARIDRGLLRGGRPKQLASQEVRPIAHKLIAIVRSYFQHCDYGLVLICCLPLGILAFDRRWLFYSVFCYIDPWIYFGYFLRLRYHLKMFTPRILWESITLDPAGFCGLSSVSTVDCRLRASRWVVLRRSHLP